VTNKKMRQAALGFRTHTGWAALIAVASSESPLQAILDRRRVEMIAGSDPEAPPYVYHAAAKLALASAERFIREAENDAFARAKEELGTAIRDLRERGYEVVVSGIIAGNRPFSSPLETILRAHSLIHAAEGELFRQAIIRASNALEVPVAAVPARELYSQAAKKLGVSIEAVRRHLAEAGRAAGKPWAQDQKESFLAALIAFGTR
jgi:hypothetical protein